MPPATTSWGNGRTTCMKRSCLGPGLAYGHDDSPFVDRLQSTPPRAGQRSWHRSPSSPFGPLLSLLSGRAISVPDRVLPSLAIGPCEALFNRVHERPVPRASPVGSSAVLVQALTAFKRNFGDEKRNQKRVAHRITNGTAIGRGTLELSVRFAKFIPPGCRVVL